MVDGKNLRRKFKTKADAQDFCNTERANKKADKTMPDGADGSLVKEWMALDAELKTAGVESLLAAGRRALKDMKAVTQSGSAQECFDAFHAALTGKRRGKYLADLRNRCGRFMKYFCKDHPERPVLEITSEVIEAYLKTLKNTGDFKTISAWLGWAAKNRWLPKNPCTGLKQEESHGKVVTLSPVEAARMLKAPARNGMYWRQSLFLFLPESDQRNFASEQKEKHQRIYSGTITRMVTFPSVRNSAKTAVAPVRGARF
jgi:hypothetical protein